MLIFGLHLLDLIIVLGFLIALLVIGVFVARGVKRESDFFLGGRKLGRPLQFFLNFGNMMDSNNAATVVSEVFRQGVAGIWIGFQTLLITPFYWFSAGWFRRVRLVTMADLFVDRFRSRFLASAYAAINIVMSLLLLGLGNVVAYKVASAMMVKPEAAYTATERWTVQLFSEYHALKAQKESGALPAAQKERFEELNHLNKKGELHSFISYLEPAPFYVGYTLIIAIYIILGGLRAAAIADALQAVLVIALSFVLIPLGLAKIGGWIGLHEAVPAEKLQVFGTAEMSDYTWYSVLGIFLASMLQIFGHLTNMSINGSARTEEAAKIGMLAGGFLKRIVIVACMLCGLVAIALFPQGLADPNHAFGALSTELLGPGWMGLMLAAVIVGHMPLVGGIAVNVSALCTRNLYEPLRPGRSEKHYLRTGQATVAIVLVMAVLMALFFSDVVTIFTTMVTFNAFFGAVVVLIFYWRRLTARAVLLSLAAWVLLIGLLPWGLPALSAIRRSPSLLLQTQESTIHVVSSATAADVEAGRAKGVGETIQKDRTVAPASVFFDSVVRINPEDANSPLEGAGRFHTERYVLYHLGLPLDRYQNAGLLASRWLFDALFPFVLLIGCSLLTKRSDPAVLEQFYGKMKTVVAPTPEQDEKEMALTHADPHRFDRLKLFPRSDWEFTRWTRRDVCAFAICWALVFAIIGLLCLVLGRGAR